ERVNTIRFDGAVVIVTGGTRGIGRAIAEAFLVAGAEVIVCGRKTPERVPQADGRCATFISCDVRDAEAGARMVDTVVARHGRIDVLVNNAGGAPSVDATAS